MVPYTLLPRRKNSFYRLL